MPGPFAAGRNPESSISTAWRAWLIEAPDGDFARFGLIKKFAAALDTALSRGWLERCGYVRAGQWQYRLTDDGKEARGRARAG
jgi:hypothetical protein